MANKKVTIRAQISYTSEDGQGVTIPTKTIEPAFTGQSHGEFDVPATTAAGDFVVPFGSVTNATAILIQNNLGQDLAVSVEAGEQSITYTGLADGKAFLIGLAMSPGGAPITGVTVTTGGVQAADGSIAYHVWGDPV